MKFYIILLTAFLLGGCSSFAPQVSVEHQNVVRKIAQENRYSQGSIQSIAQNHIATTQSHVGKAAIGMMMDSLIEEANGDLETFQNLLKKKVEKPFPGVSAPSLWDEGIMRIYIKDGHHRASMIYQIIYGNYDELPDALKAFMSKEDQLRMQENPEYNFKVKIESEFTDMPSFFRSMINENYGLLPEETREKPIFKQSMNELKNTMVIHADQLKVLQDSYKELAPSINKLKDMPLRSFIGLMFYINGIDSDLFVPYIEFFAATYLRSFFQRNNIIIPDDKINSRALAAKVWEKVSKEPGFAQFMLTNARKGQEEKAKATILNSMKENQTCIDLVRIVALPLQVN
jgi:hypothetical protein